MATLDQLGPQQRAILELVLARGQSYEDLSGVLSLPTARVRELARDALGELAPTTAERVDPQWRGQLADYILGQQTGPEARATQGHLKSSEPARMWSLSLLDSLHGLFANGTRPEIPEAGESPRRAERGSGSARQSLRAAAGRMTGRSTSAAGAGSAAATTEPADAPEGAGGSGGDRPETAPSAPAGGGSALSPEAKRVVLRRRLIAGAAALLLALVVGGAIFAATRGEDEPAAGAGSASGGAPAPPGQAAAAAPRVLGQVLLRPASGEQGVGRATLADQAGKRVLVVQAQDLGRVAEDEVLEVWLYNSDRDARSLGAQQVQRGRFQGLGDLPADAARYRFIDVSREKADRNPRHSGDSVLRGDLNDVEGAPAQPGSSAPPAAP